MALSIWIIFLMSGRQAIHLSIYSIKSCKSLYIYHEDKNWGYNRQIRPLAYPQRTFILVGESDIKWP